MNKAQQNIVQAVERINSFIEEADETVNPPGRIPVNDYESRYKELRAIKKFFGQGTSWDLIERQAPEEWIKIARQDEDFKKYYNLRREFDRLEVLVK